MGAGYKYTYCRIRKTAVLKHRKVLENHLGRLLSPEEHVHHMNGDKLDNRVENLQLVTNSEHHRKYHPKQRQRSEAEVLGAIQSAAATLSRCPTREEFQSITGVGWLATSRRFGSWAKAVHLALGIETKPFFKAKGASNKLPDTVLLEDVRRVSVLLGRSPMALEYGQHGAFNRTTLHRRFGTWDHVVARLTAPA